MEILYSIVLCVLAFVACLFSLTIFAGQIEDKIVRDIFKGVLSRYLHILDAIIDPSAIIWDPLVATFYTFVLMIKLCYQRKMGYVIKTLFKERILIRKMGFAILLWILLTIFSIYRFYIAYGLLFMIFILLILIELKKLKASYKTGKEVN